MGDYTNVGCNEDGQFFFITLANIRDTYPLVFTNKGGNRPHCQEYRNFCEKWGALKTYFEIADEKITKIGEVSGQYLNDYLLLLTYLIDKAEVDRAEDKYQENLRKAKRGR